MPDREVRTEGPWCQRKSRMREQVALHYIAPGEEEAVLAATVAKEFEPKEDPDIILLADTSNGFNNMIHKEMFWLVQHCWPRIALFTFNCYCREIRLVVCMPGWVGRHDPDE